MEESILKDIKRIDEKLNSTCYHFYEAENLQKELVAKYRGDIDHIEKDLDYEDIAFDMYGNRFETPADYRSNLNNIKAKLEWHLAKLRDEKKQPKEQPVPNVSFVTNNNNHNHSDNHSSNTNSNNLSNNNNNSNTVDVKLLFEEARNVIEDDISLGEEELQEILAKINELEQLNNSDEKPREKWEKAKGAMTWLFTKGPKVATTILPLITEVIKLNN
ncbi:hypothetical protein [Paraclostridium tenue]|uniref:Uncharacterized protein n=1 Tax=Paraclostridium tenue TaxID=1737 RepID=A0ABP3XLZ5_9FIRM